jgi:catalase
MGYSPDKMLQGRLISYPDAHRYRIGVNYEALPVNKPRCPVHTYHRDGAMRFDDNGGKAPNYEPNSFGAPQQDPKYVERPEPLGGQPAARYDHHADKNQSDYAQVGEFWKILKPEERQRLAENIAGGLGQTSEGIQQRQLPHFYKAHPEYGAAVEKALNAVKDKLAKAQHEPDLAEVGAGERRPEK